MTVANLPAYLDTTPAAMVALRKGLGLTIDEWAQYLGVSRPTIWKYETGVSAPRSMVIRDLMRQALTELEQRRNRT